MKKIFCLCLILFVVRVCFSQNNAMLGLQNYTHNVEQLVFIENPNSSTSMKGLPIANKRQIIDSTNWLHNSFAVAHIEYFKRINPDFNNFVLTKEILNPLLAESHFHGFRLFYGWKNNKIQIILVKGFIINGDGLPPQNHKSDFTMAYFWNHQTNNWILRKDRKIEILEEKEVIVANKPKIITIKRMVQSGELKQEIKGMVDAYVAHFNIPSEQEFIKGFFLGKAILDSVRYKNNTKNIRVYLARSAYKAQFEHQLFGYSYPDTQSTFLMFMNDSNFDILERMKRPRVMVGESPIRVFSTLEIPHCDGVIRNNICFSFTISHTTIKPCPNYCGDL